MHNHLFNHVDIDPKNIHIPDGTIPRDQIDKFCDQYEDMIDQAGGLDLQILGIGGTGHIGFNEPGSSIKSKTRLITLDRKTRTDAASSFYGIENVPYYALTMGVGTILKAKRIVIMAFTEGKARIARTVIEGEISTQYPATYLQKHENTVFVLENASSTYLVRNLSPWLIQGLRGEIHLEYTPQLAKKAVIWLCQKLKKPILRLTQQDYEDNGLLDLVTQVGKGNSGIVNLVVFNSLRDVITGWPGGGRPDSNPGSYFEGKKSTTPKQIIIFSPHPDDDVICMGGTISKLVNQGHNVHVSYQVSGNLAVFDSDALRFADLIQEAGIMYGIDAEKSQNLFKQIESAINDKKPGEIDCPELAHMKTLIRKTEARQAAMYLKVKRQNIFFNELPFYDTGKSQKNPLSDQDVNIIKNLILQVKPDIIYAAGDLTDPHGTHRVCLKAILKALDQLESEAPEVRSKITVYLYRGAWQEWELEKVKMAVPLSPDELYEKRMAIFKHQSQKDRPMFPGSDSREFWQRSESRNRDTANLYSSLGFVSYEALECFVTLDVLRQEGEI